MRERQPLQKAIAFRNFASRHVIRANLAQERIDFTLFSRKPRTSVSVIRPSYKSLPKTPSDAVLCVPIW